jgi:hypothetical protein
MVQLKIHKFSSCNYAFMSLVINYYRFWIIPDVWCLPKMLPGPHILRKFYRDLNERNGATVQVYPFHFMRSEFTYHPGFLCSCVAHIRLSAAFGCTVWLQLSCFRDMCRDESPNRKLSSMSGQSNYSLLTVSGTCAWNECKPSSCSHTYSTQSNWNFLLFQGPVPWSVEQAQAVAYVRLHLSKQSYEAAMWQNF